MRNILVTGHIYWTDTGERKIQRSGRNGENVETIIGKGLHTADGIVIDSSGRKVSNTNRCWNHYISINWYLLAGNSNKYIFQIYWTDGGRNSIEVAELDGSNRKVLVWTGLGMCFIKLVNPFRSYAYTVHLLNCMLNIYLPSFFIQIHPEL